MAKLTLADVTNIGGNPTSAANVINNNNQLVEDALENTLSRDGSTPNQMASDIDMNNFDLLNVDTLDANNLVVNGTDLEEQIQVAVDAAEDASNSAIAAQGSASDAAASASAAQAAEDAVEALIPTINSALQPEDIGVTVQAQDVALEAISGVTPAADRLAYFTSGVAAALATLTTFGRSLIAAASAAAARTVLELGSLATLSTINNTNWSGTDLAVANGGTGASDATTARTNLSAQESDALLTAIAALTVANGGFIRTTGTDTVAAQAINGTVSQSGGVATGALFESGTNANGSFVRTAGGFLVCWQDLTTAEAVTTATGSLFWQAADTTWTFPSTFSTAPVVVVSAVRSDRAVGAQLSGVPNTTTATVRAWSSTTLGAIGPIRCIAVGRWFNA